MSTDLDPRLLSVGGLFIDAGAHYEIPIYQRNYSWGVEQIEQLIDDVWAAARAGADDYFLGNLIVAKGREATDGGYVTFEVVDGQQRLTTLFLLLRYLGTQVKARLTYQSRRSATDALARLIDSEDEESAGIHAGFKAIKLRMARLNDADRAIFAQFLRERVLLVRATLPAATDLNKYFEIMNTRGQQLEQVDIIKARLMSYLPAGEGDAERRCLAWVWDACADIDSYIQMALTPGRTDLRTSVFGRDWDRLHGATFADLLRVEQQRSDGNPLASRGWMGLRAALEHYATYAEIPEPDDGENQRFESPIRFPVLLLHTLKVMRAADSGGDDRQLDDSRLIKLFDVAFGALGEAQRADRVRAFVETLLRCKFVLDNYVLKREYTARTGQDGAWSLKRLIRGESSGKKVSARFINAFSAGAEEGEGAPSDPQTREIVLLQSMLRVTYTSPRTMHWITAVLREGEGLVGVDRPRAGQRLGALLRDHAREKVQQAYFDKGRPTGFQIERIVFTYLDYLLATGASPDRAVDADFTFVFRNSIEHFFPQFPDQEQRGANRIASDAPEMNMLGNLALVSVGANSKFSNNLPENKIRFATIQQSAKLKLMADDVAVREADGRAWDGQAIRDHDQAMVELLLKDLAEAEAGGSSTDRAGAAPERPVYRTGRRRQAHPRTYGTGGR